MIEPNYKDILKDLELAVVGDITTLEEEREKHARDTSLFYVKPEIVRKTTVRNKCNNPIVYEEHGNGSGRPNINDTVMVSVMVRMASREKPGFHKVDENEFGDGFRYFKILTSRNKIGV